ncbi:hypothetical protein ACFL0I_00150 [Gemmatimonadota bacterium]
MNPDKSAILLWAGVGGIIGAGIIRAFAPLGGDLAQAVVKGMALIVASLAVYRFQVRSSSGD